jgi:PAS domain S-box-containing protein
MSELLFLINSNREIVAVNYAASELLQYTENELIGEPFDLILGDDEAGSSMILKNPLLFEPLKKDVLYNFDTIFKTKNEKLIDVSLSGSILKDKNNNSFLIVTGRDISERKRIENLTDRFISAITHELRTPLVSIKGYIDYILSKKQGPVPKKIESNLNIIKRNSDILLNLTNDLLDIQHIESRRLALKLEPLNYRDIINQCVEDIQPFVTQKQQKFNVELPMGNLSVHGDRNRLHQILINLLSNASKFTPENGDLSLIVTEMKETINTKITDTGIGIKKEDIQRIFEPFASIEKPSYIKGTGLGLSIAKGLTELHGGKLLVESKGEGKGATFTLVLPRWKWKR